MFGDCRFIYNQMVVNREFRDVSKFSVSKAKNEMKKKYQTEKYRDGKLNPFIQKYKHMKLGEGFK